MAKKKGFPKDSVCKPCWELKYCPYGQMVEWSPIPSENYDQEEIKKLYAGCLDNFIKGKLKTEQDVWSEIDRLIYLSPASQEYLSQFDPKEVMCEIYGHSCPVFINQYVATETKESRKQGRYLPRHIMLKVVRRDNQVCQVCHKHVPDNEIEFDHIIPYSKGGPTTVENIRLLCRTCNRKKSNSLNELLGKE
ncbi:MAG: HNH endonuclease signature motif containing protein [Thiolinea sp.]